MTTSDPALRIEPRSRSVQIACKGCGVTIALSAGIPLELALCPVCGQSVLNDESVSGTKLLRRNKKNGASGRKKSDEQWDRSLSEYRLEDGTAEALEPVVAAAVAAVMEPGQPQSAATASARPVKALAADSAPVQQIEEGPSVEELLRHVQYTVVEPNTARNLMIYAGLALALTVPIVVFGPLWLAKMRHATDQGLKKMNDVAERGTKTVEDASNRFSTNKGNDAPVDKNMPQPVTGQAASPFKKGAAPAPAPAAAPTVPTPAAIARSAASAPTGPAPATSAPRPATAPMQVATTPATPAPAPATAPAPAATSATRTLPPPARLQAPASQAWMVPATSRPAPTQAPRTSPQATRSVSAAASPRPVMAVTSSPYTPTMAMARPPAVVIMPSSVDAPAPRVSAPAQMGVMRPGHEPANPITTALKQVPEVEGMPEWMRLPTDKWPQIQMHNEGSFRGRPYIMGSNCAIIDGPGGQQWLVTAADLLAEASGISPAIHQEDFRRAFVRWNAISPEDGSRVAEVKSGNGLTVIQDHGGLLLKLPEPAIGSARPLQLSADDCQAGQALYVIIHPAEPKSEQRVYAAKVLAEPSAEGQMTLLLPPRLDCTGFYGAAVLDTCGHLAGIVTTGNEDGQVTALSASALRRMVSMRR